MGYVDALVSIVTEAVKGLAHAHERGIIHRDLKPANILISDDGEPVILDFNLAIDQHDPATQVVGGTLPYIAPQQLEAFDEKTPPHASDDVFSVGVILYELLSGKIPFASPQTDQMIDLDRLVSDRMKRPVAIRDLNRRVSPGLEAIVDRCIAPHRSSRYADATELLEDLERHRANRPLRLAPNTSVRERFNKWTLRHGRSL